MINIRKTTNTLTELFEFTLSNGWLAFFTPHRENIEYDGHTYQSIPIARDAIKYHSNLQADKVNISMGIVSVRIGASGQELTVPQIIKRDYLRFMRVRILLYDYANGGPPIVRFDGYVTGSPTYDQGALTISVGSILDKLQDRFPKLVYSEECQHRLFDKYCGLNKANYSENGTVGEGSTTTAIYSPVFNFSNKEKGWWVRGEIKMTGGNNNTISQMIIEHYDGYVIILIPFPVAVNSGDTFTVYWGCDRLGQTCANKFNNYDNFLGFEYIPKPEMLLF